MKGEIRRQGATSADSIILTVRRVVTHEVNVTIPPGTLLLNNITTEPNMVVRRLRGLMTTGSKITPTTVIQMSDDEWREYILEAYSLDFHKGQVSSRATFLAIDPLPSEALLVLEAADKLPDVSTEAIQTAIWAITDGVNQEDMFDGGYAPDLEMVRVIFETAGLDPERKRLFEEEECQTAEGCVTRGNDYYEMGEYAQALPDYTRAIELTHDYAEAFYRRGFTFIQKQAYDEAITDFTEATRLEPQHPLGYFALGIAYSSKPDPNYDQAISNLDEAILLNPNFVDAYYTRGLAYAGKQNFDQSMSDFAKVIELDSQFIDVYYARGQLLASNQNFDGAIDDFTKAIELNKDFAEAFRARGLSYSERGEHDLAVQDFQKYLVLRPEATDRQEIEGLIDALRGNIPTPEPGQVISLADATKRGWVESEIWGLGVASGDSIRLKVQRALNQEIVIVIPPGTVLSSDVSAESDMVVRRLRGLAVSDTELQPMEVILLTNDEPREYFIEAYSLNFAKADPSPTTTFSEGQFAGPEILHILEAIEQVPRATGDILAIQAAIWVVTDNIDRSDLAASRSEPDLQVVQAILQAAGLDLQCKRLFGGQPCTPEAVATASDMLPLPTATPAPLTPSPATPTTVPTPAMIPTPLPTATPLPVSACPNLQAQITYPPMDAEVSGIIKVLGTADIPNFNFYKVQYLAEDRTVLGQLNQSNQRVIEGELMEWRTDTVPPGVYWLRLIVEDPTGNYPEPCEIRVIVTP